MGLFSKLFAPKAAQPRVLVEERPWVMVYDVPTDAAWTRSDSERTGDDFVLRAFKLTRSDARLALNAKDYSVASDETIADLQARDWRAQDAQVFETVTDVRVTPCEQTLMDRLVPALEVIAEGTTSGRAQRIRERYAHAPGHQLIITAAGDIDAHERFANDIERWFTGIAFRLTR